MDQHCALHSNGQERRPQQQQQLQQQQQQQQQQLQQQQQQLNYHQQHMLHHHHQQQLQQQQQQQPQSQQQSQQNEQQRGQASISQQIYMQHQQPQICQHQQHLLQQQQQQQQQLQPLQQMQQLEQQQRQQQQRQQQSQNPQNNYHQIASHYGQLSTQQQQQQQQQCLRQQSQPAQSQQQQQQQQQLLRQQSQPVQQQAFAQQNSRTLPRCYEVSIGQAVNQRQLQQQQSLENSRYCAQPQQRQDQRNNWYHTLGNARSASSNSVLSSSTAATASNPSRPAANAASVSSIAAAGQQLYERYEGQQRGACGGAQAPVYTVQRNGRSDSPGLYQPGRAAGPIASGASTMRSNPRNEARAIPTQQMDYGFAGDRNQATGISNLASHQGCYDNIPGTSRSVRNEARSGSCSSPQRAVGLNRLHSVGDDLGRINPSNSFELNSVSCQDISRAAGAPRAPEAAQLGAPQSQGVPAPAAQAAPVQGAQANAAVARPMNHYEAAPRQANRPQALNPENPSANNCENRSGWPLPDLLNSIRPEHPPPPYEPPANQPYVPTYQPVERSYGIGGCAAGGLASAMLNMQLPMVARLRTPGGGMARSREYKVCCTQRCCVRCVVAMTTFRWVLLSFALLGMGCIMVGVILGVLHLATGSGYLLHSLLFTGLGVLLVIVITVGWRCTPQGQEPCHTFLNLTDDTLYSAAGGAAGRLIYRRRNRGCGHRDYDQWRDGGIYFPELQGGRFPPPPPSYFASVQQECPYVQRPYPPGHWYHTNTAPPAPVTAAPAITTAASSSAPATAAAAAAESVVQHNDSAAVSSAVTADNSNAQSQPAAVPNDYTTTPTRTVAPFLPSPTAAAEETDYEPIYNQRAVYDRLLSEAPNYDDVDGGEYADLNKAAAESVNKAAAESVTKTTAVSSPPAADSSCSAAYTREDSGDSIRRSTLMNDSSRDTLNVCSLPDMLTGGATYYNNPLTSTGSSINTNPPLSNSPSAHSVSTALSPSPTPSTPPYTSLTQLHPLGEYSYADCDGLFNKQSETNSEIISSSKQSSSDLHSAALVNESVLDGVLSAEQNIENHQTNNINQERTTRSENLNDICLLYDLHQSTVEKYYEHQSEHAIHNPEDLLANEMCAFNPDICNATSEVAADKQDSDLEDLVEDLEDSKSDVDDREARKYISYEAAAAEYVEFKDLTSYAALANRNRDRLSWMSECEVVG